MGARILVVEDEQAIVELLKYRLTLEGFEVFTASDGREALLAVRDKQPDIVLLDVMLPELDGFGVCRMLRRESQVPIIMLTARDSESDKVLGLELGADDYLTKPFGHQELVARIHALLRRRITPNPMEASRIEPGSGITGSSRP
jgi:two-component system response regulator VicR